MTEFRKAINTIAVVCFLISIGFYIFVDNVVTPLLTAQTLPTYIRILILGLSSLGVFTTIFSISFSFYQRYLHVKIFRIYDLSGEWYHIGIVESGSAIRHGPAHIHSDVEGITISGMNYREDNTFSSNWQSEAAAIVNRKLVLIYISEGISRNHPITRGSMVLNLIEAPPVLISGVWNDSAPHNNRGTISIFRNKSEYEERLKVYLTAKDDKLTVE